MNPGQPPQMSGNPPEGGPEFGGRGPGGFGGSTGERSTQFAIVRGANTFGDIAPATQ